MLTQAHAHITQSDSYHRCLPDPVRSAALDPPVGQNSHSGEQHPATDYPAPITMSSSQDDSQPSQDSVMTVTDENRHEIVYFAYGSNLSTAQMLERCPNSTAIGLGFLKDWGWIINARGYSNVVELGGKQGGPPPVTWDGGVWGLLYLIPPEDEDKLDRYEGVPYAYGKQHMSLLRVRDEQGMPLERPEVVKALVYVDTQRTVGDMPKEEYVVRMERGIKEAEEEWGMAAEYGNQLRAWLKKDQGGLL